MGSACVKDEPIRTNNTKIEQATIVIPFVANEITILQKQMSILMLNVEKNGNVLYTK